MDISKLKNILILLLLAFISFSIYQNSYLSRQIHERDDVILRLNNIESNRGNKVDTLINKVEKSLSFYIGGNEVSTDEFINYTNNLQYKINFLTDSLEYYKTYYKMTFNEEKDKYMVKREGDKIVYTYIGSTMDIDSAKTKINELIDVVNNQLDTLNNLILYNSLYKAGLDTYGIALKVLNEDINNLEYEFHAPKLDSALMIYPYYKDKLFYDENEKAWRIELPR